MPHRVETRRGDPPERYRPGPSACRGTVPGHPKEVKENVVDIESAEGIQYPAQHRHAVLPGPAAEATGRRRHRPRQISGTSWEPSSRESGGRAAGWSARKTGCQRVVGIGIDKAAAQICGPAEGSALLDKLIGVGVKRDHLVVEIPRIVKEIPIQRVNDAVRRKQRAASARQIRKGPVRIWALVWLGRTCIHPLFRKCRNCVGKTHCRVCGGFLWKGFVWYTVRQRRRACLRKGSEMQPWRKIIPSVPCWHE